MKKARLVLTPMDYEFIKIYHCSPEAMYSRLCERMDSKSAAEMLHGELMSHVWEVMQEKYKPVYELKKKGFLPTKYSEDTPF